MYDLIAFLVHEKSVPFLSCHPVEEISAPAAGARIYKKKALATAVARLGSDERG